MARKHNGVSRRQFLTQTTATAAGLVAAPYVKSAHSAGRLTLGLFDHWVPGANEALEAMILDWGAAQNVDVKVDFITSIGNKLLLTAQAESRAEAGHDIYSMPMWMGTLFRNSLEPLDEVISEIQSSFGAIEPVAETLCFQEGRWLATPAPTANMTFPSASRLDLFRNHADIDLQAMFPAGPREPGAADDWTYETFLTACEKLHAAGHPFGMPIAPTPDATGWLSMVFAAYGAVLIDSSGDIVIDSDESREALEYVKRLSQFMPQGIFAWDDAGNNRWLVSGQGSTIFNPPSAWAVATRDAPDIAAQIWHHDTPMGPKGRFRHGIPFFCGLWSFSENKGAAKDLLLHLASPEVVNTMLVASKGFDVPLIDSYKDNPVWNSASPPNGTLYNYPVRGDEEIMVAGLPAPKPMAAQIFTQGFFGNLVARVADGSETIDDALYWAENELAGFMRG